MDQYFVHINNNIQGNNTSTRTRFLLLDVIDLRKVNSMLHVVIAPLLYLYLYLFYSLPVPPLLLSLYLAGH